MGEALARALVVAEDRLRARGLTGGQAFDVLVDALRERLGLDAEVTPEARAVAEAVPLDTGEDLLGLAYERFFPDLFKGRHGQFFTPRPLGRLLVDQLGLEPGADVLDPTCGSGGLLIHAARAGARVRGMELDPRLARLADLSLRLAGFEPEITRGDFFRAAPEPAEVVIANPPFSVDVEDPEAPGRRVSSDRLFVEVLERWVRPRGRAGLVLPFSVLTNPSLADLRDHVDRHWHRLATCALPEGVFRPFGGASGRACLLWLQRRDGPRAVRSRWAELTDPGYDVRLRRFKRTSDAEVQALAAGRGWRALPPGAWTPPPASAPGVPLSELVTARVERVVPAGDGSVWVADLADADRATGEVFPRQVAAAGLGARVRIQAGDVLVARLRPNLGNVALAPRVDGDLVGSPEWIVLTPVRARGWVLHALRAPAWRERLPVTGGQTRPRSHVEAVLDTRVPWPGGALAERVDALSSELMAARARLGARLRRLQAAVDAFAAGELDADALAAELDAIEAERRVRGAGVEGA